MNYIIYLNPYCSSTIVTLVQSLHNELQLLAFTLFCILLSGDIQINYIFHCYKDYVLSLSFIFPHIGKFLTYLETELVCSVPRTSKIVTQENRKQN